MRGGGKLSAENALLDGTAMVLVLGDSLDFEKTETEERPAATHRYLY